MLQKYFAGKILECHSSLLNVIRHDGYLPDQHCLEKKLFVDEEEKQPPQNGGGFWSSGIVGNKASGAKRGFAQTIDVRKMGTWGFGTEKPNVLPIESGKNSNNGGILTSSKAGSVGLWSNDHHGSFLRGSRTNGQVGSGGVNNLNGSGSRVDASSESVTQKMEVFVQKPIPTKDRPAPNFCNQR